jgi:phosphatidylserine/phosphatidylglycerophosphate/cardiolipin synthase-like enzyme
MISVDVIDRLQQARRRVPKDVWTRLSFQLSTLASSPDTASIQAATGSLLNRDAAWILSEAFLRAQTTTWAEIAAVMTTVDRLCGDGRPSTEIIWTGPTNDKYPVRRIDQVLYDMVTVAQRRIVLITYAAYRIPHLSKRLAEAAARGVALTMIVESEDESEGQLSVDAIRAFGAVPAAMNRLYYWPASQRERNEKGRIAKLHAKCAIVDDEAIVGSANFTDDAFNRNMELGLVVRDQAVVAEILEHFQELIRVGVLVRVAPSNAQP